MRLTIRYSIVLAFTLVTAFSVPAEAQSSMSSPKDAGPSGNLSDEASQWVEIIQAQLHHEYATELRLLQPLAERGSARAENKLGSMYESDDAGVQQNYAEAMKWYRLSAAQGLSAAAYNLMMMYHNGSGVPKDLAEAVKWGHQALINSDKNVNQSISLLKKPIMEMMTEGGNTEFCANLTAWNKGIYLMLRGLIDYNVAEEVQNTEPRKAFTFMAEGNEFFDKSKMSAMHDCGQIAGLELILVEGTTIDVDGSDLALVVKTNGEHGVVAAQFVDWESGGARR